MELQRSAKMAANHVSSMYEYIIHRQRTC